MEQGISLEEVCATTPDGLTDAQLANCPGISDASGWTVLYLVVAVSIVVGFGGYLLVAHRRAAKKNSK